MPGCGQPSADFAFTEVGYAVTGGVAGFDRSLRIDPDGSYRATDANRPERSGRLTGAQLRELKRLLGEVDWAGLRFSYVDGRVVDSLHQSLTVRTEQVEHQTTVGTGGEPPPEVAALLAFLDSLLREALSP
ncbi:MAG: hypothetical protein ACOY93_12300 [Bacillota bacterium]